MCSGHVTFTAWLFGWEIGCTSFFFFCVNPIKWCEKYFFLWTYPKCRFFCWCEASWRWQWNALSHTLHVSDSSVNGVKIKFTCETWPNQASNTERTIFCCNFRCHLMLPAKMLPMKGATNKQSGWCIFCFVSIVRLLSWIYFICQNLYSERCTEFKQRKNLKLN